MAIQSLKGQRVDASGFLLHLREFAKVMNVSLKEVIRDQAGKFCKEMLKVTPPYASGKKGGFRDGDKLDAKKHGQENVYNSVLKILRPLEKASLNEIADSNSQEVFKLWAEQHGSTKRPKLSRWVGFRQKYATGKTIGFIRSGDMAAIEQAHFSAREDGGHGGLKAQWGAKTAPPMFLVEKQSDLERYIKLRSQSVGKLKSVWFFSAQGISAKENFPSWTQHPGLRSLAISKVDLDNPNLPSVTVGHLNGRKGMPHSMEHLYDVTLNYRAFAMRSQMANKLNKEKKSLWEISSLKMRAYFTQK